jgi:3,2-trans-enoyl-CoA isomerase
MIEKELFGETEILKFNRGVTNAINLEFVNELGDHLKRANQDDGVQGLVLASSNDKFFSIGLDIPELYELERADFAFFYRAFNRLCIDLYTLGKPTVAAITGHAIAGGCILALCSDYRFIAEGKKLMGLNERKLGVPVPYPADCILQQIAGMRNGQEIMSTGEFYQPEGLLQYGMVDRVLPLEQVVQESVLHAQSLATELGTSFEVNKRKRVEGVKERILED